MRGSVGNMVNEIVYCLILDSSLGTNIQSYYLWIPEPAIPSYFLAMTGVPLLLLTSIHIDLVSFYIFQNLI